MTKISFIVVAYNAAQSLDALLGDLLSQTIAPEQLEALLVDSASTDDTAQIMRRFAARAPFEVKLLENPKRWLASGINVALRAATGDAVIRLDAHARMPKDFLQKNLDALARGEDIVGGSVCGSPPETAWEAVTRALDTSRFCGGAAPFRNGGEARYVDTLAYALYRREVYDRVGLYDERLRRTEDNDMHYRMRKAGYRFFFSPDIVSWHAARKTLRGQLSQKWGNGYWIGRTMRIQPRCFAPRHLVPALFVLAFRLTGCDPAVFWARRAHLRDIAAQLFPPDWSYLSAIVAPLLATLRMSVTGTALGVLLALILAPLCAQNLPCPAPVRAVLRFLVQVLRSFPALILALLATFLFGLGTFSGTVAITLFTLAVSSFKVKYIWPLL